MQKNCSESIGHLKQSVQPFLAIIVVYSYIHQWPEQNGQNRRSFLVANIEKCIKVFSCWTTSCFFYHPTKKIALFILKV